MGNCCKKENPLLQFRGASKDKLPLTKPQHEQIDKLPSNHANPQREQIDPKRKQIPQNQQQEQMMAPSIISVQQDFQIIDYPTDDQLQRLRYEGQVKNGKKEARRILFSRNGNKYQGEFKDDKVHGRGTIYYQSGARYEGDWKDGQVEGKGIYYLKNGEIYDGDWINDLQQGKIIQNSQSFDLLISGGKRKIKIVQKQ